MVRSKAKKSVKKSAAAPATETPTGGTKAGKTKAGIHYVATVLEDDSISVTVLASAEGPAEYSLRVNSLDEIE